VPGVPVAVAPFLWVVVLAVGDGRMGDEVVSSGIARHAGRCGIFESRQ
jgi:hypothetical protein